MVAISDGQQHADSGGNGSFPAPASQLRRVAAMKSIGGATAIVAAINQLTADLDFATVGP